MCIFRKKKAKEKKLSQEEINELANCLGEDDMLTKGINNDDIMPFENFSDREQNFLDCVFDDEEDDEDEKTS